MEVNAEISMFRTIGTVMQNKVHPKHTRIKKRHNGNNTTEQQQTTATATKAAFAIVHSKIANSVKIIWKDIS